MLLAADKPFWAVRDLPHILILPATFHNTLDASISERFPNPGDSEAKRVAVVFHNRNPWAKKCK